MRLLAPGLAALALAVPAAATAADDFSGSVSFDRRICGKSERLRVGGRPALLLERNGARERVRLRPDGTFAARLGGSGRARATLILAGPRLSVRSGRGAPPFALELGTIAPGGGAALVVPRANRATGATNIWHVLSEAAGIAAAAAPKRLPAVPVFWSPKRNTPESRDAFGSYYLAKGSPRFGIHVDGEGRKRPGDEFSLDVLTHEYGHHVLFSLQPPDADVRTHRFDQVFPDSALPWSEGFANAFSMLVAGVPEYYLDCRKQQDVSLIDPEPDPADRQLAQWNETVVASMVWHVSRFAGGAFDPSAPPAIPQQGAEARRGFPTVLGAITAARRVERLREFRDALTAAGLERTEEDHEILHSIFGAASVGWRFSIELAFDDPREEGSEAHNSLFLEVVGPFGECRSRIDPEPSHPENGDWPGPVGALGPLAHTWRDDCLISGGDSSVSHEGNEASSASFSVDFPAVSSGARDDRFFVYARFNCVDHIHEDGDPRRSGCTSDRRVKVDLLHGPVGRWEDHFTLPVNRDVGLFNFTSLGYCGPGRDLLACRN